MDIPKQFRSFDIIVFTFCSTISLGVGFLPYVSQTEVRNAWLQVIIASIPYFIMLWLIHVFCQRYTDYDFFTALKSNLWKGLYWAIMIYFIGSTLYSIMVLTKGFSVIVNNYLLPETPDWIFQLAFLAAVALGVFYGIVAITRFVILFAVLEALVLLLIVSFSLTKSFHWIYVLPLWSSELMPFLKSSFSNVARYGGIVPLLAFILYVKKDEPLWRSMNIALGLVLFFYFSLSIIVLGTFGFHQSVHLLSPVINLVQTTTTRTGMLERMDLMFLAFWLFAFYKTIVIHVWFSHFLAKRLWRKLNVGLWIVIFLTSAFILTIITPIFLRFNLEIHNVNAFIYTLTLPILLLLYLIFKKKKVQQG